MGIGKISHIDEDTLERYALSKDLDESTLESLEEHLLVCPRCQVRLDAMDKFHKALRSAATSIQETDKLKGNNQADAAWRGYALPGTLLAAAASIAFVLWMPTQNGQPPEAVLVKMDSQRSQTSIEAPANRPLRLQLDVTGLDPSKGLFYEVIGADGKLLLRQDLSRNEANPPLPPGRYWIRIKASPEAQPLREFSLQLR